MDFDTGMIGFALRIDGGHVSGRGIAVLESDAVEITHHVVRRTGALIETWQTIRARTPVRVERVESLVLDLPVTGCEVLEWSSGWGQEFEPVCGPLTGAHVVETTAGRSSHGRHPFVAVRGDGGVLAVSVAWSGNWRIAFEPTDKGHRVTAGLHPEGFSVDLAPGAAFDSPHVVLATGADLNEIGVQFGRVGRAHWYPAADPLPNEWNHWWTYEDSRIDAGVFLQNARKAKELGLGASTLDAGWFGPSDPDSHWFDYRGDWDLVNSTRFPDGIPALSREVRELGLRFGIWCEIEAVGAKARLRQDHPEFLATRAGRDLGYACFGNPAVRSWAEAVLGRLADEGAGWIKLDFNLDPGLGCDRTDHGHGPGDGLHAHYRGYYATLDRVRAAHPGLILESCSSGGLRIDLEMLRHTDATFLSDPDWPEHGLTILWGASLMLAPERLLHWGFSQWGPTDNPHQTFDPRDPALTRERLAYYRRIAMLGSTGCSIDLTALPEWVATELAAHNAFYAKVMARFVRGGDLRRLTGQPGRGGTGDRWAAFQYSLGDEHLIVAFRLGGGEPDRTLHPLALDPGRTYTVTALDAGTTERRTGSELMRDGVTCPLSPQTSEILRLNGE